mmetsp:Transcript_29351/g.56335  ORF Transcript_29351/g.56335 Transcript_29351/m.56335 type:complete len:107 (+) Transcript_29351:142-462(+)
MGKSRAWRRSKDDQKMDTDEAPKGGAGVVSMEDDADVIDDGSKAGFGTVEGKASGPRVRQATVRRKVKLRKASAVDKALNRVDKTSSKINKRDRRQDMKKVLKKMY